MQHRLPGRFFGAQLDLARQIERPEVVKRGVAAVAESGHNLCMLYLEDAYVYPRHPAIGRKHAYTPEFMGEIAAQCAAAGLELVPCIPALGHASYITTKPGYDRYDEGRGTAGNCGSLSPSFPETYELIRDLFADWCDHVPGNFIHGGMDESANMGQYLIRTAGIDAFDRTAIFADHANKVAAIAREFGRRLCIWGDMLYYIPDAIARLDQDIVIVDWYYYPFPETPRVELFNFADIDLSGQCRAAGLEVWGAPSIWPNLPWPDLDDRWANLADWIRYGNAVGVDGLVNCEWENSRGFPEMTHFTFRVMGEQAQAPAGTPLAASVATVLERGYGIVPAGGLAADLMALGKHQMTGNPHRRDLAADPAIYASPLEQAQWQDRFAAVAGLCRNLQAPTNPAGQRLIETIVVTHGWMQLYWRLRATLPNCYAALADPTASRAGNMPEAIFTNIAEAAEALCRDYETLWDKERFPDEKRVVLDWCASVATTARAWRAALDGDAEHPLLATPRLDLGMCCRHPGLPCARVRIAWEDGAEQATGTTLIPFHGDYATPDKEWQHPAIFVLDRDDWPATVKVTAFHYGQFGVRTVQVWRHGKVRRYALAGLSGEHTQREGSTVWLGPVSATPESPLHPTHEDTATFVPA